MNKPALCSRTALGLLPPLGQRAPLLVALHTPLLAALLAVSSNALAQSPGTLYRCLDERGQTLWQQRPCAGTVLEARPLSGNHRSNASAEPPFSPLRDPAVRTELARIDAEIEALHAERRKLRAELDEAVKEEARHEPRRRAGAEHTNRPEPSERELLAAKRAQIERTKERERRYRAELRLIEKRLEQLSRERQLLLKEHPRAARSVSNQ